MAMQLDVISDKFNELTTRFSHDRMSSFTQAERAIWLLVSMRCEKDMEGFQSIFEQALSLQQLEEAIVHLKTLGLNNISTLLEQAITLLQAEDVYGMEGFPIKALLPDAEVQLDTIGDQIGDRLWDIDDDLYVLLQREQTQL